jgi:MFS family permease
VKAGPIFFGWRVVWAAFAIAILAWGTGFYGPAVFLNALHESRGWAVSTISAAITCHFLLSAGIVARLPRLHRRFGLVVATRAGGLATGLGVLAWAFAAEPWQLFPASLLSGAGWALTSGAAINAMVAPWFERGRPAALSMAFNGASVGGVLFVPLWAVLITQLGFPWAAAAIGAVMAAVVWWLAGAYLGRTPASVGLRPDDDTASGAGTAPQLMTIPLAPLPAGTAMWRDRRFATLSIAFALGLFAQIGLIAHLFSLLAPALGEAGAGLAVSLATASAVLGRTLFGMLLPARADRRVAAALNFVIQIAGSVALLAASGSSVPLLLSGCVLFGLGIGNLISLPPLIAQSEFPRGDVGQVVALVTAVNQAVFAFAPVTLGVLRDSVTWAGAPIALAALVQLAALAVVLVGRKPRQHAT